MKKLLSILAALGLTATSSVAVVACGTSKLAHPSDVDWTTQKVYVQNDDSIQFTVDKFGNDVDTSVTPTVASSMKRSPIATDGVQWLESSKTLKIQLDDAYEGGLPKGDFMFTVIFTKKDKSLTGASTLMATKNDATSSESSINIPNKTASTNSENNKLTWSFDTVGQEVDLSDPKNLKIVSSDNLPILENNSATIDGINKTVSVTLRSGLDKKTYNLKLYVGLKNGFENNNPVDLIANKDTVTTSEKTVAWDKTSQSVSTDNNSTVWIAHDNLNGKSEIDFNKDPKITLEGDTKIDDVVAKPYYEKDAHKLTIKFKDGVKKGTYKFDVTFYLKAGFSGLSTDVTILTANKDEPAKSEIQMTPDSDNDTYDSQNSYPTWTFTQTKPGADIDMTPTDNSDKDQSVVVKSINGMPIDDTLAKSFADWQDGTLKFNGAVVTGSSNSKYGENTIVFSFRLTNGFSGRVDVTLHYTYNQNK